MMMTVAIKIIRVYQDTHQNEGIKSQVLKQTREGKAHLLLLQMFPSSLPVVCYVRKWLLIFIIPVLLTLLSMTAGIALFNYSQAYMK